MPWETPAFVEIDMNAEIGGYQADDDERELDEPIVDDDDAR
jgi:hypothetical protein